MSKTRTILQTEQGSALVMAAIVLVTVLSFLALGIDLGVVLLNRWQLANAVDAAALAGVQELPGSAWNARARALEYGMRNHLQEDEMTVDVSVAQGEVGVTAKRIVDLFFAPLLGVRNVPLQVRAKARTGPVSGIGGVVPLSVQENNFVYGEQYLLKEGPHSSENCECGEQQGRRQGNFGPLALGGRGANNYRDKLKNGYNQVIHIGDVVETEPGNMAGPTADGIAWRLSQPNAAGCTFENANANCPQYVIVPIISNYEKGGRGPVTVIGFAAFFLEGTTRHGSDSYVVGRFLQRSVDAEVGNSGDFGLRAYRLVE